MCLQFYKYFVINQKFEYRTFCKNSLITDFTKQQINKRHGGALGKVMGSPKTLGCQMFSES